MARFLLCALCMLMFAAGAAAQNDTISLPITEDVVYTVRVGDTVETIGALFDVSPACIADVNELERPGRILVGDELTISISCPRYGEAPGDSGSLPVPFPREVSTFVDDCDGIRAEPGDTLDTIAQAADVSVISLQIANELPSGSRLEIGDCIVLPEDGVPYGQVPAIGSDDAGRGGGADIYIVQPRDTLDTIAQAFNISLVSLQMANMLPAGTILQPGNTLVIPAGAPAYGIIPPMDALAGGQLYVVQVGETLDEIARRFNVALAAVEFANGVNPGRNVLPGLAIIIPSAAPEYGDDDAFDPSLQDETVDVTIAGEVYVVQPRDTLYGIALAYDKDAACLAETNNLERPGFLMPGQSLVIAESCGPFTGMPILARQN